MTTLLTHYEIFFSVKVKLTVPLLCVCMCIVWKGRPRNDLYCVGRRPVESHSGARGNILAGPPNIFMGPLCRENFRMVHFGVLYISGRLRASKRRGARGSLPLPHPLDVPGRAGC